MAFTVSGHCEIREVSALIVRVELRWWPGPRHAVTMEIKIIKITRGSCNIKILKSNHHPDVDCHHVNPDNNIHKNIFHHKGPISLPRGHGERGPTFNAWVKG